MKLNQQQGFTLIELMFAAVIAGIVLAIAIPSMNQFVQNERLTSYTNTLITDLMLARAEAVKQNRPTIVCVSSNQTSCTAGELKDGWIVGVDTDNDGTLTNADQLLKVQQAIEGDINSTSTIGTVVQFDSRGFTPNTIGTITISDSRGVAHQKVLNINRTGRVSR